MSLSSKNLAIISLGCSCQVSHQLREHGASLAAEFGIEGLRVNSSYFDWLIVPVPALLAMLPRFGVPQTADEIVIYGRTAYWTTAGIWFWHHFRRPEDMEAIDIPGQFATEQAKIGYMTEKFFGLEKESKNFIFVISNAQANLCYEHCADPARFGEWFLFDQDRMRSLRDILRRRFGPRLLGLLSVENSETYSGEWELDGVVRGNLGAPYGDWKGDSTAWRPFLIQAVGDLLRQLSSNSET